MYFWKIKKLKKVLTQNALSQKSLYIYILIYVLFGQLVIEISYLYPNEEIPTKVDYFQFAFDLMAVGIGTFLCYLANGANNGKQFAERFFSISFVIGIRFLAILIPIIIVYGFLAGVSMELLDIHDEDFLFDISINIIVSVWLIMMYWRTIVHINDVATYKEKA